MNRSQRLVERLQPINEPPNLVKSFAKKSGKSEQEVEALWKEVKADVRKQYPDVKEDSDRFYELVVGILKKRLKID